MSAQQSLSYFRRIVTPQVIKFLNSTSELTLFLPTDTAWEQLNEYERIYLESEFASDDLSRILNMHAVAKTGVKWSDSFTPGVNRNIFQLKISAYPILTYIYSLNYRRNDPGSGHNRPGY